MQFSSRGALDLQLDQFDPGTEVVAYHRGPLCQLAPRPWPSCAATGIELTHNGLRLAAERVGRVA